MLGKFIRFIFNKSHQGWCAKIYPGTTSELDSIIVFLIT